MYNYFLIIGRSIFWDMQNACPIMWMFLDYSCDLIYLMDTIVHAHEGIYIYIYCLLLVGTGT